VRYVGQAFEILTPWRGTSAASGLGPEDVARLLADFHALHRQRFSYANPGAAVEIVTLRLTATGLVPKPETAHRGAGEGAASPRRRSVYLDGRWRDVPVHDRDALPAGTEIPGPAIVEEGYTTLLVQTGWTATRDGSGNLVAERREGEQGR
jgi:N-methylhydantoinase A